jgi:hypothetical protein
MLGFSTANCLEDISLSWAGKIHDNFAAVSPQPKCGVIFRLNGCCGFINVAETKYVVYGSAQTVTGKYFLLFGRCDLDKLTAHLDHYVYLTFPFGESNDRLEHVSSICDNADCFFGQMKLAKVEMSLKILKAPY